jgi:hypothetical protein
MRCWPRRLLLLMGPLSASWPRAAMVAGASVWVFLAGRCFLCENPCFELLDLFGFPWILSSESRLFNGLREINRAEIFSRRFFRWGRHRRDGKLRSWHGKGELGHTASLA